MSKMTLLVYVGMYIYGFSLMIWTIFLDKRPTKKTRYAGMVGLGVLLLTLFYFFYVLLTIGIH